MQVLGLNNGDQRSVDARPSDSIALCHAYGRPAVCLALHRQVVTHSWQRTVLLLYNQTALTLSLADYDVAADLS